MVTGNVQACSATSAEANRWDFERQLAEAGLAPLLRNRATTLQVNVGMRCNQACHHCHVEAGPARTESMTHEVAEQVIAIMRANPSLELVDITGGAPELNPSFRSLVEQARSLGYRVIDRCNLTILFEPGMEDLGAFLAEHRVEVVASLPCYTAENVDNQRGTGVFDKSIAALRRLNELGYAQGNSGLILDLVHNPLGAFLPPPQAELEERYHQELEQHFGIHFNRLFTITNMPIRRFAASLVRDGRLDEYMSLLVNHFNPQTVPGLMCRSLVSIGWDGQLYDCDFNQMLEIPLGASFETVFDLESLAPLAGRPIATDWHCFGCTAGAGSTCGGAIQKTPN